MTADVIGGRYELLDRLGAGGMGEVYRSRDRLTEEIVALKRALYMPAAWAGTTPTQLSLAKSSPEDETAPLGVSSPVPASSEKSHVARLELASEFRVLSSLRHPHIISVLDYGFQTLQCSGDRPASHGAGFRRRRAPGKRPRRNYGIHCA